ncbi:MAG: mannose-1-phosphate guanyltransferase [Betaproteobacteria bacterium]|nr:MAG: mannose-1-phosphate guanyltransferase [Betaproteobacteria bacterium]
MTPLQPFSWARFVAIARKELVQMRRDRLTFAMIVGVPILQLVLFGYAINADPKQLPTAVVDHDRTVFSRSLVQAVANTGYFRVVAVPAGEDAADRMLERGRAQFAIVVPPGFGRALQRGERPALLVAADATDPSATGNAIAALTTLGAAALRHDLSGPLAALAPPPGPFEVRLQRRYNPEGVTQHNIVPGLLGVILQMTMVMMTAFAVTRERERGTFENLLATPATPLEVMTGKIVPYIAVGFAQATIILAAAKLLFDVPMLGSGALLVACMTLFIAALLALGFTISTVARTQLQAMQMTFFFFLPSLLLSGFMFPFRGMPGWAQALGEVFPLTHFLRVVRGVLLKGNGAADTLPHLWPIALFMLAAAAVALLRYRRTLD